jgi:chitodextrinase
MRRWLAATTALLILVTGLSGVPATAEESAQEPGPVRNLLAAADADGFRLTWDPPEGFPAATGDVAIAGVGVVAEGVPSGFTVAWKDVPGSPVTVTVTSVAYRRFRGPGVSLTVARPGPVVPSAPRELTAAPTPLTTSIDLNWRPPESDGGSPIEAYRIDWGFGELMTTGTSMEVDGLWAGTRYTFRVTALNAAGESPAASVTATTRLDPVPRPDRPGMPTALRVMGSTATSVALDWEPPRSPSDPPVLGYRVSVQGGSTIEVPGTSALVSGLASDRVYTITVRSFSTGGESAPVEVLARTTAGPAPKPQPAPQPLPGGNTDGSLDTDGRPETVRQTAPGSWPTRTTVRAGRALPIAKQSGFRTNAGQVATLKATAMSPSIARVRIALDPATKAYTMTATLKPGKVSGSVVLTVSAPPTTVKGVTYELMQSSQRFIVRRAS